jgi:hypothetical protein
LLTTTSEGSYPLQGQKGAALLLACLATGRIFWDRLPALTPGESTRLKARWHLQQNGQRQLDFDLPAGNIICCSLSPIFLIDRSEGCVTELISSCQPALLKQMSSRASLSPEDTTEFNHEFSKTEGMPVARMLTVHQLSPTTPTPKLVLSGSDDIARAELYFVYDNEVFNSHQLKEDQHALRFIREGQLYQCLRDFEAENTYRQQVSEFIILPDAKGMTLPGKRAWLSFMVQAYEALIHQGWQVEIQDHFPYCLISKTSWYGELAITRPDSSDMDWFTLEIGILVDGKSVNILPSLVDQLRHYSPEALRGTKSFADESHEQQIDQQLLLLLDDGRYLPVPLQRIQNILRTLIELCDKDCLNDAGLLTLPYSQARRHH